jgi:superfamily I DNA/RNA helicase
MNHTQEQLAVVNSRGTRIIVQANPGSGKSETLVARVRGDQVRGIPAANQYVITYTVAAAEELRRRMGDHAPGFIGTTHSFCLMLVREFGRDLGYSRDIRVINEEDSARIMQEIADKMEIKKIDRKLTGTYNQGSPQQIVARLHLQAMRSASMVDFQTMQHEAIRLLQHERIPSNIHGLYIDEAQDTSELEAILYDLINARIKMAFGDVNQSIFGWRGATGSLMTHGFINAINNERLSLTVNHRSRQGVINAANNLRKRLRGDDNIAALYEGDHGSVTCVKCWGALDQQMECIKAASFFVDNHQSIAILCRLNQQVDTIREALSDHHLLSSLIKPPEEISGPDAKNAAEALAFLNGSELVNIAGYLDVLEDEDSLDTRHFYQSGEINIHTALRSLRLTPRQIRIAEVATDGGQRSANDAILCLLEGLSPSAGSKLHIGTIHSAKGREWDHVIVCGADADQWEDKGRDETEQRRLFYVATTRARISVTYMHITDKPSKFVKEAITGV